MIAFSKDVCVRARTPRGQGVARVMLGVSYATRGRPQLASQRHRQLSTKSSGPPPPLGSSLSSSSVGAWSPPQRPAYRAREDIPWALVALACYLFGGLASSTYWLFGLHEPVKQACYKCKTEAWGVDRQLEGLDELAAWMEWAATAVGVDACPKLVAQYEAHQCVALGLESEHADVRAIAFEALASLTREDGLARRVADTTAARGALSRELSRLAASPSEGWSDVFAARLSVLVSLGNMTRDAAVWGGAPLEAVVTSVVRILAELRDAADETQQRRAPPQPQRSRLGSLVAELQESVLRDMVAELLAAALAVAHHVSRLAGGAELLASEPRALELLAELAWSDDPDCALHANFALHNTIDRLGDKGRRTLARLEAPEPELGQPSGLSPRSALALNRMLDAFAPLPFSLALAWGAARRVYRWHASGETFARSTAKLPRVAAYSALATGLVSSFLTAAYGTRGARYEFRRSIHWPDDDANQIALATLVTTFDFCAIAIALRIAPFAVTPFILVNTFI